GAACSAPRPGFPRTGGHSSCRPPWRPWAPGNGSSSRATCSSRAARARPPHPASGPPGPILRIPGPGRPPPSSRGRAAPAARRARPAPSFASQDPVGLLGDALDALRQRLVELGGTHVAGLVREVLVLVVVVAARGDDLDDRQGAGGGARAQDGHRQFAPLDVA